MYEVEVVGPNAVPVTFAQLPKLPSSSCKVAVPPDLVFKAAMVASKKKVGLASQLAAVYFQYPGLLAGVSVSEVVLKGMATSIWVSLVASVVGESMTIMRAFLAVTCVPPASENTTYSVWPAGGVKEALRNLV